MFTTVLMLALTLNQRRSRERSVVFSTEAEKRLSGLEAQRHAVQHLIAAWPPTSSLSCKGHQATHAALNPIL